KRSWGWAVGGIGCLAVAVACSSSSSGDDNATDTDAGNGDDIDTGIVLPPEQDAGVDAGKHYEAELLFEQRRTQADGGPPPAEGTIVFGSSVSGLFSACDRHDDDTSTVATTNAACKIVTCSLHPEAGPVDRTIYDAGVLTFTSSLNPTGVITPITSTMKTNFYQLALPPLWLPGDNTASVAISESTFPAISATGLTTPSGLLTIGVNGTSPPTDTITISKAGGLYVTYSGGVPGTEVRLLLSSGDGDEQVDLQCDFEGTSGSQTIGAADLAALKTGGSLNIGSVYIHQVPIENGTAEVRLEGDSVTSNVTITN
ncbi:MAG TPA: hypothetical protein VF407_21090, partial [Polyangiaceae bacterium]